LIDRYGKPTGNYAAPFGTPFGERGLPRAAIHNAYNHYVVTSPINVQSGISAGSFWLGSSGGDVQFFFDYPIQYYIDNGFLTPL